jgi:hypothetical protein
MITEKKKGTKHTSTQTHKHTNTYRNYQTRSIPMWENFKENKAKKLQTQEHTNTQTNKK